MGCSNSLDGNAPANGSYSVSGKISFAGSSGAAPVIFTPDSNGRTATTSFNNEHLSLNLYAYKYDNEGNLLTEKKYDNVVVDQSGSFVFCFEEKCEYKIYAEVLRNGIKCATGMTKVEITGYSSNTINIKTIPLVTENGKIQLNVSAATDITPQIKKVYVSWLSSFSGFIEDDNNASHGSAEHEAAMEKMNAVTSGKYNKSFDVVNGSATITYNEFPGGNWLAKISFEDETGNSLYSCQEIINVYPTFTTNRWYGSSPALSNGTFKITKSMVTNYDAERIPNTDYVLYTNASENYQYYLRSSPSASVSGTADVSASLNSFCFDADGNFYSLDFDVSTYEYTIYKNNEQLATLQDLNDYRLKIIVDLATNILYTWAINGYSLLITKYSNLISDGSMTETTAYSINGPSIRVDDDTNTTIGPDICTIYNGIVYVIECDSSDFEMGSYFCGVPLQSATYELTETECVNLCLEEKGLGNALSQDMIYQDGSVYILYKESDTYKSRGAVLRYNTCSGDIDTLGLAGAIDNDSLAGAKVSTYVWDSVNEINKPLYNDEDCTNRWYVDADKVWNSTEIYSPNSFESLSTSQFYGPSKFVAIKPKKLVIADDGIAFYTDNDVLKYKNVNRVVTVDLERFAIENTEDTSVTFDSDKSEMIDIGNTGLTVYQDALADEVDVNHKKYYGSNSNEYLTTVSGDTIVLAIPCGD